ICRDRVKKEDVLKVMKKVRSDFIKVYHEEKRTMLTEERIELIADYLDVSVSKAEKNKLESYFSKVSLHRPPPLVNGVSEFIRTVKRKGVPLVMISDTGYTKGCHMRKLLKMHNIADYFDFFVFSDETHSAKPAVSNFRIVEKNFREIPPEKMIHIGDNPETDIKGGEFAGWETILFRRKGDIPKSFSGRAVTSYKTLTSIIENSKSSLKKQEKA
ncbi:MAG: HAD-IA family hydrolase, partial [bacterium]